MGHAPEGVHVGGEHEEEVAAEGAEDDGKLEDKGGEAHKAELDRGGNLLEGLLETENEKVFFKRVSREIFSAGVSTKTQSISIFLIH